MAVNQIDTTNYMVAVPYLKTRFTALYRAVFAYVRANPAATPAQVGTYANGLTRVLTADAVTPSPPTNSAILTNWFTSLGLTAQQTLDWVRTIDDDDIVQLADTAQGIPPVAAPQAYHDRMVGKYISQGVYPVADLTIAEPVRDAFNCPIQEQISGTVNGTIRTVRRTTTWDRTGPAWIPNRSPWVLV